MPSDVFSIGFRLSDVKRLIFHWQSQRFPPPRFIDWFFFAVFPVVFELFFLFFLISSWNYLVSAFNRLMVNKKKKKYFSFLFLSNQFVVDENLTINVSSCHFNSLFCFFSIIYLFFFFSLLSLSFVWILIFFFISKRVFRRIRLHFRFIPALSSIALFFDIPSRSIIILVCRFILKKIFLPSKYILNSVKRIAFWLERLKRQLK